MVCQGGARVVLFSMSPEKRQGSCFDGVIPISLRIFMMGLYQFWGDCLRPYRVLLRIQKSLGPDSISSRGGRTMVISSSGSRVLQKNFCSRIAELCAFSWWPWR